MVNWKSRKLGDVLSLANSIVAIMMINILSSMFFFRADLTDEKRYSIKDTTKKLLQSLDDHVYVEVYLEGDMNASFQRFQKAIRETLEEFTIYSHHRVQYVFTDPATAISRKAQSEFMADLASKGIQPTRVVDSKNGQRIEKLIFPGAIVSYGGVETGVMLLKGNRAGSSEEAINQSMEGIEFELANAIYKLTNDNPRRIGLVYGHGEPDSLDIAAFASALIEVYNIGKVSLHSTDLHTYDALVIAKPVKPFSDIEKYKLDQYILQGGNVLFLLDKLEANMDSASNKSNFAFPYNLNLDDQLFKYGIRINADLIQDRSSGLHAVITGQIGNKPQIQYMEWPFYPLINRYADHPITHNLDAVMLKFASSIDTVKAMGITKTPLMFTSQQSRTVSAPVNVSVEALTKEIKEEKYTRQFIPVAYLLEGKFTSLYKNRFLPEGEDPALFRETGKPAKIIVVSDGDIVRNEVNPQTHRPQPLGFDRSSNYTFANQDLLMNMLAYLTHENSLLQARNKEISIRPLDKEKITDEKFKWQVINLGLPFVLLIIFGITRSVIRKRRYARF